MKEKTCNFFLIFYKKITKQNMQTYLFSKFKKNNAKIQKYKLTNY